MTNVSGDLQPAAPAKFGALKSPGLQNETQPLEKAFPRLMINWGKDLNETLSQVRSDPNKTLLFEISFLDEATNRSLTSLFASFGNIPLIVVLDSTDVIVVIKLLAIGIRACLIKPARWEDLRRAAQAARNGSVFLCDRVQQLMVHWISTACANLHFDSLSDREREIAYLLLIKKSDKEIAQRLSISPGTVHVHLSRVYKKLGIHSRADLVMRLFHLR
jgi:DNA-binding NarL/FixJ family response regulator